MTLPLLPGWNHSSGKGKVAEEPLLRRERAWKWQFESRKTTVLCPGIAHCCLGSLHPWLSIMLTMTLNKSQHRSSALSFWTHPMTSELASLSFLVPDTGTIPADDLSRAPSLHGSAILSSVYAAPMPTTATAYCPQHMGPLMITRMQDCWLWLLWDGIIRLAPLRAWCQVRTVYSSSRHLLKDTWNGSKWKYFFKKKEKKKKNSPGKKTLWPV